MKILRSILNWLRRHPFLSLVLVALTAGGISYANILKTRSQGHLTPPLTRGRAVQAVYGIGTVIANRSFQVKGGITSHLDGSFVNEGDQVRRGDRLVLIDENVVRAPFDGTVTYFPYKSGELLFAQTPVLTLVDLKDRYMTVSLEQQGALQIRPRQEVRISFDTLRNETYEGVVRAVYSNQNDFLARIDVHDLPDRILPGMTADVAITIQKKDDVLLVPVAALEGSSVWVKSASGLPRKVDLRIGIVDRDVAEVLEGDVKEGDRLVIRGKGSP